MDKVEVIKPTSQLYSRLKLSYIHLTQIAKRHQVHLIRVGKSDHLAHLPRDHPVLVRTPTLARLSRTELSTSQIVNNRCKTVQ
jgi:hypothetical protein